MLVVLVAVSMVMGVTIADDDIESGGTYKIIQVVGISAVSWEDAVKNAVETAALGGQTSATVKELYVIIEYGKVTSFRAKLHLSYKDEE